jgi:hypothetical protein
MSKQPRITKRLNLSIPPSLYEDLIYVSSVLGVTSSGLIMQCIGESIPYMAKALHELEASPSAATAKRLRGQSVDFIAARYQETMQDLDKGDDNVH